MPSPRLRQVDTPLHLLSTLVEKDHLPITYVFPGYIPYQWPALLCLLLLFCPTLLACALAEVQTSQEGSLIWINMCAIGTEPVERK